MSHNTPSFSIWQKETKQEWQTRVSWRFQDLLGEIMTDLRYLTEEVDKADGPSYKDGKEQKKYSKPSLNSPELNLDDK